MKKLLIAFCLIGIFNNVVTATQISQKQISDYIVKGNNITMCYFPEVWSAQSPEEQSKILQDWAADPDKRHLAWVYYSLRYPLLADSFGEQNAKAIMEGQLDLGRYVEKVSEKKKNKTTVKTDKDCEVLWEDVNRLIKTYHYFDVSAE